MTTEHVLTNARIVLADGMIDGTVVLEHGLISSIDEGGSSVAGAEDLGGDYLVPGLVDLHTDALNIHF